MRLAKKDNHAVLALDIQGSTRVGRPVLVTHDVKIELMSPADAGRLNEPLCPDPNVSICRGFFRYTSQPRSTQNVGSEEHTVSPRRHQ